jgi:hypothetical protein
MGRDIHAFIERRRNNGKWECLIDDINCSLYRDSTIFEYLSYNSYEGEKCIYQKPLKDWVATLSPEVNNYVYIRIDKSLDNCSPLFNRDDIDYNSILESLDTECIVDEDKVLRWIAEGVSFLLTDDIISNPDACYWNWCTADELEWAIKEFYLDNQFNSLEDDEYFLTAEMMRDYEREGYEVRMVYSYDESSNWLNMEPETEIKDKSNGQ